MSSFAKKSLWNIPPYMGPPIPQQELVDEEVCPDYDSTAFYPARPEEVLAKRFQLLFKIGWGSQSTVWLARDVSSNSVDVARHEKEIECHIKQQNPEHRGRGILRTCLDDFKVTANEPMREPLWIFHKRFVDRRLSLSIAKAYIYIFLVGLDYLHTDERLLWLFENKTTLTDFIERQQPMHYKVHNESGRTIYRYHTGFGALDSRGIKKMIPKLADFVLATRLGKPSTRNGMLGEQLGIYPIQPDHYRAPEVILGCSWDSKVDIWNFGVLLWNSLVSEELFQQVYDTNGHYNANSQLAEMIALLGPPPSALLRRPKAFLELNWPRPVTNDTGKLCHNVQELFGGPFFDTEDESLHSELKDREVSLSFVQQMLTWLQEERKTARELIDHPFLEFGS
ncbi:putative serine/threonine-protein kinase [Aspergillus nidulans var. acristatus]